MYFKKDNPHPRLWKLLADTALEQLNFPLADRAFVQIKDFSGIQLVKRLQLLTDKRRQKAEVAAYFKRFDEAEQLYIQVKTKINK